MPPKPPSAEAPRRRKVFVANRGSRLIEGMALRRLREKIKPRLTQKELARRLGLKEPASISKIESGQRDLSLSEIQTYLTALGYTLDEFLEMRAWVAVENQGLLRKLDPEHADDLIAEAQVRVRPWLEAEPPPDH